MNTSLAHDDAVSQLSMHENLLVSSSCDSTVKVKIFRFFWQTLFTESRY